MNTAERNIQKIQQLVKESVIELLDEHGYSITHEEKFGHNQALLLQLTNQERNHTFQLRWDTRENWFDLGEFDRTNNLNFIGSKEIDIFPYTVIGLFSRAKYDANYVSKIKSKIVEKLNITQ